MLHSLSLQPTQTNRLNIMDLHRKINMKNEKKSRCYEKVLDLCQKRIINFTDREKTSCFFDFPEYVIGYPLFDLNACMQYCQNQLMTSGFLVHYYFPNKFYISWDFDEIKQHRAEQRKQTSLVSMLPNSKQPKQPKQLIQGVSVTPNPTQQHITLNIPYQDPQQLSPQSIQRSSTGYKSTPITTLQSMNSENSQTVVTSQQPTQSSGVSTATKPENTTFWTKQPQTQVPSTLHARMVAPLPSALPKYDPFDIYPSVPTGSSSTPKKVSGGGASAIDNTFYANNLKQMLASGIGGNKQIFDYKPSGKLSLNI